MKRCEKKNGTKSIQITRNSFTTIRAIDIMHHFGNWLQMNSTCIIYLDLSIKNIMMQSKHVREGAYQHTNACERFSNWRWCKL